MVWASISAHELAADGYDLVLVARREELLCELATELEARFSIRTKVIAMDLTQPGIGTELKRQLDKKAIAIDVLINNAGFGIFGEFIGQPLEKTLNMLQLNIAALTELTHVFATDMVRSGSGQILLVASVVAYQASPNYAAYGASKAYVLSLGEALHEELLPHGVTVTVLSPGATATEFFDVSGQDATPMKRAFMMPSRPVVQIGLEAMRRGRASVVAGWKNALVTWSTRLIPRKWQRKIAHRVLRKGLRRRNENAANSRQYRAGGATTAQAGAGRSIGRASHCADPQAFAAAAQTHQPTGQLRQFADECGVVACQCRAMRTWHHDASGQVRRPPFARLITTMC